jgi:hypothetical protein
MRNLIIILIFISLLACNQNIEKNDTSIGKFEQILGKQETTYLDEIVADFDNYLADNYPDQNSKFEAYLNDVPKLEVGEYWKIDSNKMKKYRESSLFGKYDTIYPDSVWFDGQTFKIKYPNFNIVEEIIPLKRINEEINIDSTINSLRIEPRFLLKEEGTLYLALDSVKQSDYLIITYLDAKEAAGNLSLSILANGLKSYLTESNEYFAKRIFAMNMFERQRITVANTQ